jgi:hypothetical protein
MPTIRLVILHAAFAPERAPNVLTLRRQLGGRVEVWEEHDRRGVWPAYRDIVRSTGRDDWLAVIQDDIKAVPHLGLDLPALLDQAGERPVGLLVGTRVVRQARDRGGSFLASPDAWLGGATVWPTALAHDMVRWCDREVSAAFPHEDRRMQLYCLSEGVTGWFTSPCLVDYEPYRSLLGHHNRPPGWYDGRPASAWDWSLGAPVRWSRGVEGRTAREWAAVTARAARRQTPSDAPHGATGTARR